MEPEPSKEKVAVYLEDNQYIGNMDFLIEEADTALLTGDTETAKRKYQEFAEFLRRSGLKVTRKGEESWQELESVDQVYRLLENGLESVESESIEETLRLMGVKPEPVRNLYSELGEVDYT